MNIFLILSVLVLIAISIWQITKIFELSQAKKINTQIADDSDNNLNGKLMFAFLIFIYGITIYSFGLMVMFYYQMQLRNMVLTMII
jgi:cytochrome c oxidase subunit 2